MPLRFSLVSLLTGATLVALGACSDSTAPHGITITVNTSVATPIIGSDTAGRPTITCEVTFHAAAAGKGVADWLDGTYRFYYGKDRTVAVDSFPIKASDIAAAWGQDTIDAGETERSTWDVTADIPFSGEIEFRYHNGVGATTSAKADFTCGPAMPASVAPPEITSLTVWPSAGALSPGDSIVVSFGATAQTGLWETLVNIAGPCVVQRRFFERFAPSSTHQVGVPLPPGCNLGVPIDVEIQAVDDAAQVARHAIVTSVVIRDTLPPTVAPGYLTPAGLETTPSIDYFTGDSITVLPVAADNHALAGVFWRVLPYGVVDSVLTPTGTAPNTIRVPIQSTWTGPLQLQVWARDAAGLTSDTATTPPDSIRVHPTVMPPTRTASVTGPIEDALIDQRRGVVYLLQFDENRIAVLSMSTLQVVGQIPVELPMDFDLTAGGDTLLVASSYHSALGVVDLRQSTLAVTWLPLTSLNASLSEFPYRVRGGANGKAYVAFGPWPGSGEDLLEVDLPSGAQRLRTDAGMSGNIGAGLLGRSLDHGVVAMNAGRNCLQLLDLSSNAISACFDPGSSWPPTLDANGGRMAVGASVFDGVTLIAKLPSSFSPGALQESMSPDGSVLYVLSWNDGIVRANAATGQILDRTIAPINSSVLHVSPDGSTLVGVNAGQIVLVDLTH